MLQFSRAYGSAVSREVVQRKASRQINEGEKRIIKEEPDEQKAEQDFRARNMASRTYGS
jgi:hypothetical protein